MYDEFLLIHEVLKKWTLYTFAEIREYSLKSEKVKLYKDRIKYDKCTSKPCVILHSSSGLRI
jgi:hypothetical protein